jgi:hypothetical protein
MNEYGLAMSSITIDNIGFYRDYTTSAMLAAPFLNDSIRQTFGLSFDQMVISCQFNTQQCTLTGSSVA